MATPRTERWHDIADPGAARVARLLWVMIPRVRGRFGVTWPLIDRPDEPQRIALRKALEASSLAEDILRHPDRLEDIRPRLAQPWRALALRHLPLSYEIRIFLLALYLDWYLGLSRELPAGRLQHAPVLKLYFGLPVILLAIALFISGLLFAKDSYEATWPIWLLAAATMLAAAFSIYSSSMTRRQWPRFLALYHYCCDQWQSAAGTDRPGAETAATHSDIP